MANSKCIREKLKMSQKDFSQRFNIPLRTVQNWDLRNCMPEYIALMVQCSLCENADGIDCIILNRCIKDGMCKDFERRVT